MIRLIGADSSARWPIRQLDSTRIHLKWPWPETAKDEVAVTINLTVQVTLAGPFPMFGSIQLLGVRRPGGALVRLNYQAIISDECFSLMSDEWFLIMRHQAASGQSAARPAHSKELTPHDTFNECAGNPS
jgi:hypothetical protein